MDYVASRDFSVIIFGKFLCALNPIGPNLEEHILAGSNGRKIVSCDLTHLAILH